MFVFLCKWGDTAAPTDSTLGAFCNLPRGENKAKTSANCGVCLCQRVTTKPKEQMSGLPKKTEIWLFSPSSLWTIFPFKCGGILQGASSDVGWGWGGVQSCFCALCRNWEISEGCMELLPGPGGPGMMLSSRHITKIQHPGKGAVGGKSGGECWRHSSDWGPGHHCWHHISWRSGFLPAVVWLWPGFLPKLWNVFVYLQSNNNRNICLELVWEILSDDLLGLPVLEFLLPIMAQRLGTFHHQGWGSCSIGVVFIFCCSWLLT